MNKEKEDFYLRNFKPEYREKNRSLLKTKMPFGAFKGNTIFEILEKKPYYFLGIIRCDWISGTLKDAILRGYSIADEMRQSSLEASCYGSLPNSPNDDDDWDEEAAENDQDFAHF